MKTEVKTPCIVYEFKDPSGLIGFRILDADATIVCQQYPQPLQSHVNREMMEHIVNCVNGWDALVAENQKMRKALKRLALHESEVANPILRLAGSIATEAL